MPGCRSPSVTTPILTLGENATVVVDRFVFDPDASVGEATLNATKGAFRMVTGRISDMTNKDIKVKTLVRGGVGVRGTDFWSGQVQGQDGVLLVHNSRLEVRGNKCPEGSESVTGAAVAAPLRSIRRRKAPTLIVARGALCLPRIWTAAEINSALSTTSFSLAFAPTQVLPAALGLSRGAYRFRGFHQSE